MSHVNVMVASGNITRDAELKHLNSGVAICQFSIAQNYRKKSGDSYNDVAQYLECKLWGKYAESVAKYLIKGTRVTVSGEWRQETWESDGRKRSKIVLLVNTIDIVGGSNGNKNQNQNNYNSGDDDVIGF